MPGFRLVEELPCLVHPSLSHILHTLADAFLGVRVGGDIQQVLISFGIKHGHVPIEALTARTSLERLVIVRDRLGKREQFAQQFFRRCELDVQLSGT